MRANETITDKFGNTVKEGDTVLFETSVRTFDGKRIFTVHSAEIVKIKDFGSLEYFYIRTQDDLVLLTLWANPFWLKGCPQMHPQPDPNLVERFESDLDTITNLIGWEESYKIDKRKKEFIQKYKPYLQPHNTGKDGKRNT